MLERTLAKLSVAKGMALAFILTLAAGSSQANGQKIGPMESTLSLFWVSKDSKAS